MLVPRMGGSVRTCRPTPGKGGRFARPPVGRGRRTLTVHLQQARPRGSYRAAVDPATIDLGNEPPLSVDGDVGGVDRRRVSVRWFTGTILTGLCGAALMGGAVFAALDGETNFAATAERFEVALRGALGERPVTRKSDRLPPAGDSNAARQVIRVSTAMHVGDREVMRVRPFVRVASNLSLSTSELSANIPPFNPQRMLSDSGAASPSEDAAAAASAEPDAEVSFVTRDLAALLPKAKIAAVEPLDEVISHVREAANWTGSTVNNPARWTVASLGPTPRLAYANEGTPDPYSGFEARVFPENITLLPKTTTQSAASANDRTITVRKGDTVATILRDLGATPPEIAAIAGLLGPRGRDGGLKEGQKLRVLLSPVSLAGQRLQPVRVTVIGDAGAEAVVALSDMGKYVPVDVQSTETQITESDDESDDDDGSGVRLYQSIYETALRNQIPKPVIEDLVRIYSYDVDFQRKAQPGDSFEVLYAGEDDAATADAKSDILFASLTVGGETKKFYRFQSPDDGIVDYYDETGKSAKKFLVRKPVAQGIMRSGFGARKHPLLGYTRAHTGVDWAAPMGTPIYASGNGVIEKMGWEGGYGRYIRLRHTNGYETAYGHMSAFARGIDVGSRVRQGQVIGFIGSTGLSTGAHLHYEILINGRFVDPMKIKLPRGRVLEGQALARFDRERQRIEGMMTQSPARVAQSGLMR
jgi:murein DD-endopeptidase MepM/ murein hydrolase activator NlpD